MSEACIWKTIITYLKLSNLNPKRVRGIHKNPKLVLGREPLPNEDVYYYWVELDNKIHSEYGIIDRDTWNNRFTDEDYNKETGNKYGLLENEINQLSKEIIFMITMTYNEKDVNKKKKCIKLLEQLWCNL